MVEINPPGGNQPPKAPGPTPAPFGKAAGLPGSSGGAYQAGGTGWESYEKWMGPKGFKEFQKNLMQSIVAQVSKDKKKEHETSLKLQAAEKGEDPNDV